jgi:hypothetical protein
MRLALLDKWLYTVPSAQTGVILVPYEGERAQNTLCYNVTELYNLHKEEYPGSAPSVPHAREDQEAAPQPHRHSPVGGEEHPDYPRPGSGPPQ